MKHGGEILSDNHTSGIGNGLITQSHRQPHKKEKRPERGRSDQGRQAPPTSSSRQEDEKAHLRCTHCGGSRHTVEVCFQIIGYPEWWPDAKKKGKKGRLATGNSTVTDSELEGDGGVGFGGIIAGGRVPDERRSAQKVPEDAGTKNEGIGFGGVILPPKPSSSSSFLNKVKGNSVTKLPPVRYIPQWIVTFLRQNITSRPLLVLRGRSRMRLSSGYIPLSCQRLFQQRK